jgi:RNA polymerase sigma-70 factor (ECF subfamily)
MGQMENRNDTSTIPPKDEPSLSLPDLIASYGDRLLRSAYLMCGHSGNAQDIVQETFCRALAALPGFRREAGVYTWLFSIMRNVYLKHRRHERRFFHFLARQPRVLHAEGNPVENCERQRAQTQLLATLQTLPVKQREIIILRFVNDLKIADIARILSLPEGTVKSRLFNASNRLQALINARCGRSLSVCEEAHEL